MQKIKLYLYTPPGLGKRFLSLHFQTFIKRNRHYCNNVFWYARRCPRDIVRETEGDVK